MTTDEDVSSKACATETKSSSDDAQVKQGGADENVNPAHCSAPEDIANLNDNVVVKGGDTVPASCSSETLSDESAKSAVELPSPEELVEFKVIYNKEKFDVSFSLDKTVLVLKQHIEKLTGVPSTMQKLLYKGMAKDDKTLRDCNLIAGAKVMVIGSTLTDVLAVNAPQPRQASGSSSETPVSTKESLSQQKIHKKIVDRGVPPDAMPAWRNGKAVLPPEPLSGMVNKSGGKVRLTFKLEADQLWIGTKERTEKVSMQSVRAVVSEPIEGHEEYHIVGIQLGPTEASRYWVYWVPAQYIEAIKETIIGG